MFLLIFAGPIQYLTHTNTSLYYTISSLLVLYQCALNNLELFSVYLDLFMAQV